MDDPFVESNGSGPESGDPTRQSAAMHGQSESDCWAKQRREAQAIAADSHQKITSTHIRARRLHLLSTLLGVVATVLAAIAALTASPEDISPWVTAGCAFTAALITGITTIFNPVQMAHRSLMQYVRWTRLCDDAHRFDRWLDTPRHKPFEKVEHALGVLQQQRDRILEEEATGSERGVSAVVSELARQTPGDDGGRATG
jgi:hypothetical protein